MNITVGALWENVTGRYGVQDIRLNENDFLEIHFGNHWSRGQIERRDGKLIWVSLVDQVPLPLKPGLLVRYQEGGFFRF